MEKLSIKSVTKAQKISPADLVRQYVNLREERKSLNVEMVQVQEKIKALMKDGKLKTRYGTAELESRTSYAWSLESLKNVFGDGWIQYVKSDDKLVKIKSETMPELLKQAEVEITEAFTVRI